MNTLKRINDQKAQGMVEFALVLPILLLVILGIFAFGHLFFVYSSVVSASREAARWGAAVGEAPSAAPRYQDCNSIRSAATRVGSFAGVGPNSVAVNYDHGPVNPPNAPVVFANCPLGGTGPDDTLVRRGDRIVVRVTVQYTPIVPFVNLPSFPLSAETGRTIVKSLPVGDAPVAEDPCVTTTEIHIAENPGSSFAVTGQPVTFGMTVEAADGTIPTGTATYADGTNSFGPVTLVNGQASFTVAFETAGQKHLSFRYESDNECQMGSAITDYPYDVVPADTEIVISDPIDPSGRGHDLYVTVQLRVLPPGAATTAGPAGGPINVSINTGGGANTCAATLNSLLNMTCALNPNRDGYFVITANYPGDSNFNSSTDTEPHQVIPPETATFIPSPTRIQPTGTGVAATATPVPWCPYFESDSLDLSSPPTAFTVGIRNRDMYDLTVRRVIVSWPTSGQTARLTQVRFFDSSQIGDTCRNSDHNQCIWWAGNNNQALFNGNPLSLGNPPPSGTWSNNNPGIARNASRLMRLVFTTDLALQGPYYLEVEFANSQGQTCRTNPVINYTR